MVSDMLEIEGYRVLRCADPDTALKTIENERPVLVLMDIGLPGMDGMQLTKIIKSRPHLSSIIIVALTAFAMKEDKERVMAAGCDGYITKPIDTRKFKDEVETFLKKKA
jgi:two-component system cell cycle response regulator DivK